MLKKDPSTYVIIFYIIIIAALLTWVIPGGEYVENKIVENGVEKKLYEFHYADNVKQTWQVFAALFKGFVRQSGIIVFSRNYPDLRSIDRSSGCCQNSL